MIVSILITGCAPSSAPLTHEEEAFLCKAATATLYGRPIEIITIESREKGVTYTSYVRPDDGTIWKSKFRIQNGKIDWGAADGRWRNHAQDEKLSYTIDREAGLLTIQTSYSDGSGQKKQFPLK